MLTGFWHGAEWTFVVWGLYFGILLIMEKTFLLKQLERFKVLGHVYSLILVVISFVIFDSANLSEAWKRVSAMFGAGDIPAMTMVTGYYLKSYLVVFLLALVGATPLPKYLVQKCAAGKVTGKVVEILEPVVMAALLLVSTGYLVDGSFNPFLYFRESINKDFF